MPEFQGWLKKSPINMDKAFGLKWMDKSLKDWIPPRELLHYDKKHLYD